MGENISIFLPLSQHEERHTLGQTFLAVPLSQLDLEGESETINCGSGMCIRSSSLIKTSW